MQRCFTATKRTPFAPLEKFCNVHAPLPWIHGKCVPIAYPAATVPQQRRKPSNEGDGEIEEDEVLCYVLGERKFETSTVYAE
ncbi:hypothetical protein KC19_VG057800 [Ceratodon purpureus]|uniref:Uncharacterized protein n=1 Tax=Ceratodon purpureus TaxID=3225 RepID=A0A8T0HMF1_CERPU|nr:hypothetical protein KC19_VG057800 [Ceratodon purpureus]